MTKEGQTLRMPLTSVDVVTADEFKICCDGIKGKIFSVALLQAEGKSSERDAMTREGWDALYLKMRNATDLEVGSAHTDVDGKFRIRIPKPGTYVVRAHGQRTIGTEELHYRWFVPLNVTMTGEVKLELSNQNLADDPWSVALKFPLPNEP